ncbi:protein CURVATURE THYLAKOID 1C, chloroplastic isoform X1 [Sorghum bicolor]|uniref:protein CURVATURE THYLAKOID 1C, chloroplastic isoform X1 n=1 Tax=Sorghum bicolor TaxID=4558 RepID=UPI000B425C86|nr:protein CURVATURE THYLAKOID 1C, chloroplastic isoform X1 [Sorghum bicolor]|eukprot:XP_021312360.1 protein CURVATURE THYLAKOID 1C, chloroplastic isoform X1 [Sorghum bicolor]
MMMACGLAVAQPAASLAPSGKRSLSGGRPPWLPSPRLFSDKLIRSRSVVAKAAQDSSESSGSIVKYVTSSFSTAEDIFGLAGIGFAAIAALWASVNLIEIIDKLPVLPLLFELVGILVAWLFIYNNLLFKPKSRHERMTAGPLWIHSLHSKL